MKDCEMLRNLAFFFILNSCIIRFSFWKDHIGCRVDGELEMVESRGRDTNKKSTAVVHMRDGEGWWGRHSGALPRLPFPRLEPPPCHPQQ